MVGMPEIDILGVSMDSKNASTCVLEFDVFFMLLCWKIIYILEKLLGNRLILSKNDGKTFTESCNNLSWGQ